MNNGWSIDGLQRGSTNSNARRHATKSNTMISRASKKQVVAQKSSTMQARKVKQTADAGSRIQVSRKTSGKPVVSRNRALGIPDSKAELKRLEKESKPKVTPPKHANFAEDEEVAAIKDFLNESKDLNPTDLVELPQKDKKALRKERKRLKKQAKLAGGKKKKGKVGKIIALIFLLLVIGGGVYVYHYLNSFVADVTDDGSIIGLLFSDSNTPLEKDENGRTNILIFGTEGWDMNDPNYDGGYLTDSMMVLSLNQDTNDAKVISLPRDMKYPTCTSTSKLNEVFWCTFSQNDGSPESVKEHEVAGGTELEEAFETITGLDIQYRVHLNWQAVVQIVDAIGGIDVVFTYEDQTWDGPEVTIETSDPRGLADGDGYKLYYNYPNGQVVHLTGEWALAVARTRNAYGGWGAVSGNFSREYFQQRIIQAIVQKVRGTNLTSDLSAVLAIKGAVGDNLRTNFKDTEIKTMMKVAENFNVDGLKSLSLYSDTEDGLGEALLTTGNINGISYVYPYAGVGQYYAIHNFVNRAVKAEAFVTEMAKIVVINAACVGDECTPGVAAREQTTLNDEGYNAFKTGNRGDDIEEFDGVHVYKLSDGKDQTTEALKGFYGVDIITDNIPESVKAYSDEADFVVVVGNSFSHDNK